MVRLLSSSPSSSNTTSTPTNAITNGDNTITATANNNNNSTSGSTLTTVTNNNSNKNSNNKLQLAELAKWVPLRLSATERSLLTVLEQTMHVSEYTDHVDVAASSSSSSYYYSSHHRRLSGGANHTKRVLHGILEACHIAIGLSMGQHLSVMAQNNNNNNEEEQVDKKKKKKLKKMKKLLLKTKKSKKVAASAGTGATMETDLREYATFFQTLFEIGRRHKVLNPASMRTTYGKLMYLLQDAQNPTVAKSLGFSLHKDLVLVQPYLEEHDCLQLLDDPRLECAVQYIAARDAATGERLDRTQIQAMVEGKKRVTEELVQAYSNENTTTTTSTTSKLSAEQVRRVIESLADGIAYIESNVRPVEIMIKYLEDRFHPAEAQKGFSLALRGNTNMLSATNSSSYLRYGYSAYSRGSSDGPTLSHSHSEQYTFVWQSLRLWSKVMRHMHRLWVCADDDLLSTTSSYHLYNTGQGLNRVQACPRVRKVMSTLLHQTQQEAGRPWVGLSVIHLGDRDVPNALIFIDKYTQIPRFLNPIVHFLQGLPELCQDERVDDYIKNQFGSRDQLEMTVLADYFKHGFDGSGDDGGSCIDGRLTSSWNWTSRIVKKNYYHAFMLSGFQGFDGDFQ